MPHFSHHNLRHRGGMCRELCRFYPYSLKEYVIVIRLGVSDIVEVDEQRFIVSVHTSMNCYNPPTMALISSETSVSSVGYGSSYEAAASDAFKRAGRILADVLMIDL